MRVDLQPAPGETQERVHTRELAADTIPARASCPSRRERSAFALRSALTKDASLPVRTSDDSSLWRLTTDTSGPILREDLRRPFLDGARHVAKRGSEDRFCYTAPPWPRTRSRIRRVDPSTESRFGGSRFQSQVVGRAAITSPHFRARLAVVKALASLDPHRRAAALTTTRSSARVALA
jgi:hypothetical protein